jgi:hypothetical protein
MVVWIAKRALPRLGGRAMFDLPPPTPTVQVEFATTGMASGIAQTVGPQLVVRGGLDFKVFQLGTYTKNVEAGGIKGVEAGVSIDVRRMVAGFTLDGQALFKRRFGMSASGDATEWDLSLIASRPVGPVTAIATVVYTHDIYGPAAQTLLIQGGLQYKMLAGTVLAASFGHRFEQSGNDYTEYNLGVTQAIGKRFQLDLRWYDTAQSELGYNYRARFVAALTASF